MATRHELDADSIAAIGLMFLDGDTLEALLIDRIGHTDYDFGAFNALKRPLMKVERINPALAVTAVLWQLRPDNANVALPVVCGKTLPFEGWRSAPVSDELRRALDGAFGVVQPRSAVCTSHYYPLRNSDDEVVGALELIIGEKEANDI